jgi:hypothetical protein
MGDVSKFHAAVELQLRRLWKRDCRIFFDREIRSGQRWREVLEQRLNDVNFMIAMLSPSFFASKECRAEVDAFVETSGRGPNGLVFPVVIESIDDVNRDDFFHRMMDRQVADFTTLKYKPPDSEQFREFIGRFATDLNVALTRPSESTSRAPKVAPPSPKSASPNFPESTWRLPPNVPRILKLHDRKIGLISLGAGVALGSVVSLWLSLPRSALRVVFALARPRFAFSCGILCLLGWTISLCVFRLLRQRALEKFMGKENLAGAVSAVLNEGIEPQLGMLGRHPLGDVHPLFRGMRALVEQWSREPSLQHADTVFQRLDAVDNEGLRSRNRLIRSLIWGMPLIGLTGTIFVVTSAVGEISGFLGSSHGVAPMRYELLWIREVLVLSLITALEGSLGALAALLTTRVVQLREEQLNNRIRRFLIEQYLPAIAKAKPEKKRK